jgi:hypothetical protein
MPTYFCNVIYMTILFFIILKKKKKKVFKEVLEDKGLTVVQVVFPNLKSLKLSSVGLEDTQHNQHGATKSLWLLENMSRFQNLLQLEVQGSNNIKYLLSYSTARCLVQLKYLHILKCEVMEEILVTEVAEETISEVLFPLLDSLHLKELPILKRLCKGSNIKFPALKELVIEHCPNFKTFISKPTILGMTTWCKELKEMNAGESPHTAVQPLFNEEVNLFYLFHWFDSKLKAKTKNH